MNYILNIGFCKVYFEPIKWNGVDCEIDTYIKTTDIIPLFHFHSGETEGKCCGSILEFFYKSLMETHRTLNSTGLPKNMRS